MGPVTYVLKSLETVNMSCPKVTDDGVKWLQKRLPKAGIVSHRR
jgi:hypothetical protein